MKENLTYIKINVKCGQKFLNKTKECKIQYIEHLPENLISQGLKIEVLYELNMTKLY